MTDLKFLILEHLYKNGRSELFPNFYELNPEDDDAVFYALQELASIRLIKIAPNYDVVFLTPSGAAAYEEEARHRENKSGKKQFRQTLLATVIGSVVTLLIEHSIEIIEWFLSFFR